MSNFQRFMRSRGQSESIVLLSLTIFDIDFNSFKNIFFPQDEFVRTYKEKQFSRI